MKVFLDEWVPGIAVYVWDDPDYLSLLFGLEDVPVPTGIVKRLLPLLDLLLCDGFVLESHGKIPFLIEFAALFYILFFYCYFYFNQKLLLFFCFMFNYKPNNTAF